MSPFITRPVSFNDVICVSLRMAASVEAPSAPMWLNLILQAMGRMGTVREYRRVNGRWHKSDHYQVAAHLSSEIIVSLRTAAIAEAPLSPMLLARRLQARGVWGDGERLSSA